MASWPFLDKGEGGVGEKKKRERPLGPGALLVHSDFSLKLRTLALWSSNPPGNLFAPFDSQELRHLGHGALAPSSAEVRSDILVSNLSKKPKSNLVLLISSNLVPKKENNQLFDLKQPCARGVPLGT